MRKEIYLRCSANKNNEMLYYYKNNEMFLHFIVHYYNCKTL